LEELEKLSDSDRLKLRYQKFRAYGRVTEKIEPSPDSAPATAANGSAKSAVKRAAGSH
jgi:hypothetical protein